MKTVKLENTLGTKIESISFPSDTLTTEKMSKVKPQMTELQQMGMMKTKQLIEENQKQEKLQQVYIRLRQNLETCREARPDSFDSTKTENAIDHFENMAKTIEAKIEEIKQNAERQIQYIKDNLAKSLSSQQTKLNYAQDKLNKAKERKNKVKKSKEEIRLEKQLQQLLVDWKRTNPDKDVEYYFPGYKSLLGYTPTVPLEAPQPSPLPTETNKNLVVEPLEEEEPEEEPDFTQLTPWQRFQKVNSGMNLYNQYQKAKEMGIEPDIPEPEKPAKRRAKVVKTATETISREDLAKFIPNYA